MKNVCGILLLLFAQIGIAQNGIIKGSVTDRQSEAPLEGATVELLNAEPAVGVITDANGNFRLTDVPVGRHAVRVSYIGFETITIPNIVVTSGKEADVNLTLAENFLQLDEVVLSAETNKDRALNEMAKVSARQFGVEEVTRFSGGRGDVGRLAANFAGVSSPNDSRNDIVVRAIPRAGCYGGWKGFPFPVPTISRPRALRAARYRP